MSQHPPVSVAVLTPTPTHPKDYGNRKRLFHFCDSLRKRGADVSLILYPLEADWAWRFPKDHLQAMRDEWTNVDVVVRSGVVHPPPQDDDHTIDEWWDPALEGFLKWYFASRNVDVFITHYVYLSKALTFAPRGTVRVLDTHDVFAGRRQRLADAGIKPEFFHTTEPEETRGLNRADVVVAIKDEEAEDFRTRVRGEVLTLNYCEANRTLPVKPLDPSGMVRFGFIGAANSFNERNLTRFLNTALPLWRSHMAPIELVVAGSVCNLLTGFSETPYVTLLGRVDDVAAFYASIDVALIPMDVSTGQKIKTGEALGFGLPTVGHAHAFEGYPTTSPLHECRSMHVLAEACMMLAFEPHRIASLRSDTQRAQYLHTLRTEQQIDAVWRACIEARRTVVVAADAVKVVASLPFAAHLLTIAHLYGGSSRAVVWLNGDCGPELEGFVAAASRFSTVAVSGRVSEDMTSGVTGSIRLLDCLGRAELGSHIWLYTDPDELAEPDQWVSVGWSIEFAHPSLAGQRASGRFDRMGSTYLLGHAASEDGSKVAVTATRTLQGPLFSNGASDLVLPRYRSTHVRVGWFITSPENQAMARAVAQIWLARQNSEKAIAVIIGESIDEDGTISVAAWRGTRETAVPQLDDLLAKPGEFGPAVMLDLTAKGSPSSAVVDFLDFAGAVIVRPGVDAARATATLGLNEVIAALEAANARRRTPRPAGTFGALLDDVVPSRRSTALLSEFLD